MKRLMISLLGALAFAAAAQAVEPQASGPQAVEPQAVEPQAAAATTPGTQDETRKPEINDRLCLRHTGTRINPRNAADRCNRMANGRAYTRDDLNMTGETDIADALRKLDPSIH